MRNIWKKSRRILRKRKEIIIDKNRHKNVPIIFLEISINLWKKQRICDIKYNSIIIICNNIQKRNNQEEKMSENIYKIYNINENKDEYNFKYIDLFAGIGGIRMPFQNLGGKCVFSSEIDKYAAQTYEANYGEKPSGDITQISAESIPNFDILLAGFPCQAFSIAGKRKGFDDTRGTMFFEVERILEEKKPKCFLLENVKGLTNHDHGRTFKVMLDILENKLNYKVYYKVLNAKNFRITTKQRKNNDCRI